MLLTSVRFFVILDCYLVKQDLLEHTYHDSVMTMQIATGAVYSNKGRFTGQIITYLLESTEPDKTQFYHTVQNNIQL